MDNFFDFKVNFFVFFQGYALSVLFLFFENNIKQKYDSILSSRIFQYGLYALTCAWLIFYYKKSPNFVPHERKFDFLTKPGLYCSVLIFLLLCSDSNVNSIKFFLENSDLLKSFGKYSFGIYLLHPTIILYFYEDDHYKIGYNTFQLNLSIIIISYYSGFLWYFLLERRMIDFASKLCKRVKF